MKSSNLMLRIVIGIVLFTTLMLAQKNKVPQIELVELLYQRAGELYQEGRYQEAIPIMQEVLIFHEKTFGVSHKNVASILNNLAMLYETLGQLKEAEPLYKRALNIYEEELGPEHPHVSVALNNLAELYRNEGNYKKAEPLYKRALNIREQTVGKDHPHYAIVLNNLGLLFYDQGKYDLAEKNYKQALMIREQAFGAEHLHVANSLSSLGTLYKSQGQYKEAESHHKRALEIREQVMGNAHPDVASSLSNLGNLYAVQGLYSKAESHHRRALEIREQVMGNAHPVVASSLSNLGNLYKTQGFYGEAELFINQALEILRQMFGNTHPDVLFGLMDLANTYYYQGRFEASEALYKQVNETLELLFGTESLEVATVSNHLGVLYSFQGYFAKAEEYLERALLIQESISKNGNPDLANVLNNLALLYYFQSRFEESEALYKQALKIQEEVFGKEHIYMAFTLNNLAGIYDIQNRLDLAESYYRQALLLRERKLGRDHPDMGSSLNNLAGLYRAQARQIDAASMFTRAHSNLFKQLQTNFFGMSEKEKGQFYHQLKSSFEAFYSFVMEAKEEMPSLTRNTYRIQTALKALLLNSVVNIRKQISRKSDKDLLNVYSKWKREKENLANIYSLSESEIARQEINKDSLEKVTNDLEKVLSRRSEAFARTFDTTLHTWRDIQASLDVGEAAVELIRFRWYERAWTDTIYYAALIVTPETKDQPEMVVLTNGNDLEGKHQQDYKRCREMKSGIAYRQYWQPIREKLAGIKKVYLSPDGVYNQINLNILYNSKSKQYLMDEIDIHLVTNTKDILQFGKREITVNTAQLFGRPAYDLDRNQYKEALAGLKRSGSAEALSDRESSERLRAEFSDLIGTEKEVSDIHYLLNNSGWESIPYLGEIALEEAVKSVYNPRVLHIATHGFFIASEAEDFRKNQRTIIPIGFGDEQLKQPATLNPMLRSGLILAGAESYLKAEHKPDTDDGILTAYEAANLNLDNTELVVLSACETGLGEVRNGEGVYGLQRAFKVAGAKTILMSLWKVDDAATQELMTVFYKNWLAHGDKRKAFRQAQQQLREKYEKPEYWGAFVMVGE